MTESLHRRDKGQSLLLFFGMTFLITWVVWLLLIYFQLESPLAKLGTFGPTISALILIGLQQGKDGLRALAGKLTRWRVSWIWYAVSLAAPALVIIAALQIYQALGGANLVFNDPGEWYLVLVVFFYVLFTSVLGEEIGWRGYAFPRLLRSFSPLGASLILGLIWGLWHLPLFWMPWDFHSEMAFLPFLIQVLASSVIYGWLYVNTGGSLLIIHLFHTASNASAGLLPLLPMSTGGDLRPFWLAVGLLTAVAVIIFLWCGSDLTRDKKIGDPAPEQEEENVNQ
mgnify:CR=1 FL=1